MMSSAGMDAKIALQEIISTPIMNREWSNDWIQCSMTRCPRPLFTSIIHGSLWPSLRRVSVYLPLPTRSSMYNVRAQYIHIHRTWLSIRFWRAEKGRLASGFLIFSAVHSCIHSHGLATASSQHPLMNEARWKLDYILHGTVQYTAINNADSQLIKINQ